MTTLRNILLITALNVFTGLNLVAMGTTAIAADTAPTYQNVVIFGDSQSDIGNGPESRLLTARDTPTNAVAFNYYVPLSNPVNLQHNVILPSLSSTLIQPASTDAYMTLPAQPTIDNHDGTTTPRQFRSLNWVGYFMTNAVKRHLLPSTTTITPWALQYSHWISKPNSQHASSPLSLNYAWYSALSTNLCGDVAKHNQQPQCSLDSTSTIAAQEQQIYQRQQRYRDHQSATDKQLNHTLLYHMLVPGAQKQVVMYAHDKSTRHIHHDPSKTLYIVWAGANDLHAAIGIHLLSALNQTIPDTIAGYQQATPSVVDRLVTLGARHILVVGQYNLGDSPGMVSTMKDRKLQDQITADFNFLSTWYNTSLKARVQQYQQHFHQAHPHANLDLRFVDIQTAFNNVVTPAHSPFYHTLGQRCDQAPPHRSQLQQGLAVSCDTKTSNTTTYGWWNALHLATQLNQVVAQQILQAATPHS